MQRDGRARDGQAGEGAPKGGDLDRRRLGDVAAGGRACVKEFQCLAPV